MKRTLEYIIKDMSLMETFLSRRDVKYRRNYNRYYNNFNRMEDIWTVYGNVVSYFTQTDETVGEIPYYNIIRSAIDTTASKLSQTKVRPFFNPVLGTFKTVKTCRNAQIYFDEYYEMQNVYKKAVNSITDTLIFDMGVIWINDENKSIEKIGPWEFIFDVGEMTFGKLTRCEVRRKQYPLIMLRDIFKSDSEYAARLEDTPNAYVDYRIYYDLIGKVQYKFIGTDLIQTRKITYDVPPFVWIYYKDPVKGAFSDSMLDGIYRIQKMVDDITYKISVATQLSPANMIFIPRSTDLKTSMIASSKIGDVFEYNAQPGPGNPVIVSTPPIIDPMYLQLLEMFEQKAYNMVGVSQLSAQSKKPSGLNSGVALQTLEDVESERHNVLLGNYIRFVRDIAERMIEIFPDNDEILPKRRARSVTTWKDIKKEREMFNIQYSASNSLSKDPKVKMEQIEKLIAMKIIDPSVASTLLEMPDLEGAYSVATAAYDMNEKTIERVIENGPDPESGKFYFYECTNIQQLYAQTINTLLRLDANDENPEVLENLTAFIGQLKDMMDEINTALAPPAPPAPIQPPVAPGPTNNLPLEAMPPQ
jgi:hypothetical protein